MDIIEILKLSISSLLSFKTRTFLTMLGIIMGIASVVLISSLGEGFQRKILSDFKATSANVILVDVNKKYSNKVKGSDAFEKSDLSNISKLPEISATSFNYYDGGIERNSGEEMYAQINGVDKNYKIVMNTKLESGRWFTEDELNSESQITLIDRLYANKVFKNESPLGKTIKIEDYNSGEIKTYVIIGTFKSDSENIASMFSGAQHLEMLIPINTVFLNTYNINKTSFSVLARVNENYEMPKAVTKLKAFVNQNKTEKDFYDVKPLSDELKQVTNILDKISIFISLIASISIIVGGVGVMNIMLVSVKERITEIGLRKAIGAKNKAIMAQFLIETMILTVLGGIIGLLFGLSLAFVIGSFIKIIPALKFKVLLTAILVSGGTGIIFGIYPAKQAAKLSPIEALRKE